MEDLHKVLGLPKYRITYDTFYIKLSIIQCVNSWTGQFNVFRNGQKERKERREEIKSIERKVSEGKERKGE